MKQRIYRIEERTDEWMLKELARSLNTCLVIRDNKILKTDAIMDELRFVHSRILEEVRTASTRVVGKQRDEEFKKKVENILQELQGGGNGRRLLIGLKSWIENRSQT